MDTGHHHLETPMRWLQTAGLQLIPLLARALFAFTLLAFFWKSALTKLGDGITGFWLPSAGAYGQILPLQFEAVGYDPSAMSALNWAIVMLGTYAEFILPACIVIGFLARFAALGMIGFIVVMSLVDVTGHGVALGSLLDGDPSGLIPDQRLFWIFPLVAIFFFGAGPLSIDRRIHVRRQTRKHEDNQ